MEGFTQQDISDIKKYYFLLDAPSRNKIMSIAQELSDGDEQLFYSLILYFSQKENYMELQSVFKEISKNAGVEEFSESGQSSDKPRRQARGKNSNS